MSSVARGGQRVARAVHVAAAAAPPTAKRVPGAARRNMGGHARHIGLPGEHVPIHVGELHKKLGTVYLTTMFLWMMYRAKQDGLVLLVSYRLRLYGRAIKADVVVSDVLRLFLGGHALLYMRIIALLFSLSWHVQDEL